MRPGPAETCALGARGLSPRREGAQEVTAAARPPRPARPRPAPAPGPEPRPRRPPRQPAGSGHAPAAPRRPAPPRPEPAVTRQQRQVVAHVVRSVLRVPLARHVCLPAQHAGTGRRPTSRRRARATAPLGGPRGEGKRTRHSAPGDPRRQSTRQQSQMLEVDAQGWKSRRPFCPLWSPAPGHRSCHLWVCPHPPPSPPSLATRFLLHSICPGSATHQGPCSPATLGGNEMREGKLVK